MLGRVATGLIALAVLGLGACASYPAPTREIALTFDDAPLPDGPYFTGQERTRRLIAALRGAGVREAAIYSTPGNEERPGEMERIRAYAAAGHAIANHSMTHPNLADVSAEAYLADVAQADAVLRPMPGFRPWFRFPYLSEGDTVEKRDTVREGLTRMGYAQGYVTADSYDWRMDMLWRAAVDNGQRVDLDELRDLYVRTVVEAANHADELAVALMGRSPRHVMLMHENDLSALFIEDAVDALRREGWRVITATQAFDDPIAREMPNTLQLGSGRIVAMIHASGPRERFPIYRSSWDALDGPFVERVLHLPPGTDPPVSPSPAIP